MPHAFTRSQLLPSSAICSFIFQVASARRQRSDLFGLRVKLPLVMVEAIPLSA